MVVVVVVRAKEKKNRKSYAKHNERRDAERDSLKAIKKIYISGCRSLIYKAIFVVSQLVRVALRPERSPLDSARRKALFWIGLIAGGRGFASLSLPPILERDPYVCLRRTLVGPQPTPRRAFCSLERYWLAIF